MHNERATAKPSWCPGVGVLVALYYWQWVVLRESDPDPLLKTSKDKVTLLNLVKPESDLLSRRQGLSNALI